MGITTAILPYISWVEGASKNETQFLEPAHNLRVVDDVDVIVCGAGPAGVSAAILAARSGAKVRLFGVHGCLGGIWTAGLQSWVYDFNKPGLTKEITDRLEDPDAKKGTDSWAFICEPDEMKLLLEDLCVEAGVKFRLQTRLVAAYRNGRQLTTIVTESESGRESWKAKVFIDATGDGDLGALSDCGWDIGEGKDCYCQPMTMNALAIVKNVTQLQKFLFFYNGDYSTYQNAVKNFKNEIIRAGINPSYGEPTLFHVRDNLVMMMVNQEYGIKPYDADGMTTATVHVRREIFDIAHRLRQLGGIWDGFQIITSAEQIGVREGRRIHGRYTIVKDDLIKGAKFDDGVCRVTFPVDIHADTRVKNDKEAISRGGIKTQPYDIPLRALIAKDVDGLMMAGRCISGDSIAHGSYRVTGNAVATGEAAGAVASLASQSKRMPHEVEWKEAEKLLLRQRSLSHE